MKVAVIYNPQKDVSKLIREIAELLRKFKIGYKFIKLNEITCKALQGSNFGITLGGNGTILKSARYILDLEVPIIGVNMGTEGVISAFNVEEIIDYIPVLLRKKPLILQTPVLNVIVEKDRKIFENVAVNDCVIRASMPRVIMLNVNIDNFTLPDYICDGLIISTPMGSTAYSFSAFGPIVHPFSKSLIITPIAPFKGTSRSIVVPDTSVINVSIPKYKSNKNIVLSIDGQVNFKVGAGGKIIAKKHDKHLKLVLNPKSNYFYTLSKLIR